jgi:hypothetical protein
MIDPDGHAACRLGREDCADLASFGSKLAALRSAAAADAAVADAAVADAAVRAH